MMRLVKTGLPETPKAGDLVRYDLTITVDQSPASAVTLVDDLPTGLLPSTVRFVSGPVGTVMGNQITWVIGTVTPGVVTVSFTVQVDPAAEAESVLRNLGHATSPDTVDAEAFADTKVRGDVRVTAAVYNEAGEVVKTLPMRYLSKPVDELDLSPDGVISALGESLTMTWGDGRVLGAWDGLGEDGQLVSNGSYYVKVDSVDAYGTTTSVTRALSVNRAVSKVEVVVYNEAGEAVRHLLSLWSGPIDNITKAYLTANVISPSAGESGGVTVTAVMSGGTVLAVWDGRSDKGSIVNNGQYYVELKVEDGQESSSTLDLPVAVLTDRSGPRSLVVKPNTLTAKHRVAVLDGGVVGGTVDARVYSLSGTLVKTLQGVPGNGTAVLDGSDLASGLYIVVGKGRSATGDVVEDFQKKVLVIW